MDDYEYDQKLDAKNKLMDMFDPSAIGVINHPCFDYIAQAHTSIDRFKQAIRENRNLIVYGELLNVVENRDPDKIHNPQRHAQYTNYLRYLTVQFVTNPWWYSRLGQLNWYFTCHARHDSTIPLGWDDVFGIDEWYRAGEKPRLMPYQEKAIPEPRPYKDRFVFKKRGE